MESNHDWAQALCGQQLHEPIADHLWIRRRELNLAAATLPPRLQDPEGVAPFKDCEPSDFVAITSSMALDRDKGPTRERSRKIGDKSLCQLSLDGRF